MNRLTITLILFCFSLILAAQDFSNLKYRELGPYRGGRVTAVAGVASQPGTFYFGATGGGVWKTEDYGTTWHNITDGFFKTPSIGSIAVAQNDPNVIYVGTGSDGLRSNVIAGKGMYKSIDGGKTWKHMGLEKAGQIGAVRIHPQYHNIVYVAAIGQAFRPNSERGIYKSTDGGKTWDKILFHSEKVGFYDLEFLPSNPEVLFATAWKAERKPWTITSGGTAEEGGVYKSTDGGKNWEKITQGLPADLIGKIDLALSPADSRIVYALVEAPGDEGGLYRSIDQGESFKLVSNEGGIRTRPFYYTNVRVDPTNPEIVYVLATGYFKSENGGKEWTRMRPPHGDNHDMWIHPDDPDLFIQANDGGANVTFNGGKTWSTQFNQPTAELYQVEVDDQYPYWLYAGQQDNYSTIAVPSMPPYGVQASGIGYVINTGGCETGPAVPKPGNPDIVYANCKGRFTVFDKRTGTEKAYYVGASNIYGHNPKDLRYRFQRVSPIHVSPHDPDVVYHCSQFVHKTTNEGQSWETISPDLTAFEADKQVISGDPITRDITGEEFYSTIYSIRESPLQEGLIWVGANDGPVHVTRDGGKNWTDVTPADLPAGGRVDAVEPSPHDPAKAYISVLRYQLGDDKPYLYKTEDFGKTWALLTDGSNGIPADYPTRVIREDPEQEGLLFAGTEYGLFISFDDGFQWKPFQQNLPVTPVTDLKIHRGDLVLSTMGRGFWVLDNIGPLRQADWTALKEPTFFQPRSTIRRRMPSGSWNSTMPRYPRPAVILDYFLPEKSEELLKMEIVDEEGQSVATFFSDTTDTDAGFQVMEDMSTNQVEFLIEKGLENEKGLNRFRWDMTCMGPWHREASRRYQGGPMAAPGKYTARLTVGGRTLEQSFELLMDPRLGPETLEKETVVRHLDFQMQVRDLLSQARQMEWELEKKKKELKEETNRTASEEEQLKQIESMLARLKTEEGTYRQPMLNDQISYLYSMLRRADQQPGQDAIERFEELREGLQELKGEVD